METSFAVTAVDQETLKNSPAIGLAALLTSVPGLYGEASAGEVNLNISSRGVRGRLPRNTSASRKIGLPFLLQTDFWRSWSCVGT